MLEIVCFCEGSKQGERKTFDISTSKNSGIVFYGLSKQKVGGFFLFFLTRYSKVID